MPSLIAHHVELAVQQPQPPPTPPPPRDLPRPGDSRITALFWIAAWFGCSLVTLFLNKTLLTQFRCNEYVLGIAQMSSTALYGALAVYYGRHSRPPSSPSPAGRAARRGFMRDMLLVGLMRGVTVLLGLISLSHVAVSFTETVKSSAPFFTVIFARLILHQHTSWQVNLSLVPVMLGLALTSATELSFDTVGFLAAISNNIVDCVQNVYSKKLLQQLSPEQLQFYTSAAAATLQLPLLAYLLWPQMTGAAAMLDGRLLFWLAVDGVFYHLQSVTAYYTMSLLTPVSQSVANTVKRSLLICLSILYFGNPVSALSLGGTAVVVCGVLTYNHCRINFPSPAFAVH